jgi:hypothetical protein
MKASIFFIESILQASAPTHIGRLEKIWGP